MPCSSCVDKLAVRLMQNHKIDMVRAYEIAEKGMERHERAEAEPFINEVKSGNPTDYTQTCIQGTCYEDGSTCNAGAPCTISSQCTGICKVTGSCGCPAPLPNSHLVTACSVTCTAAGTCVRCIGAPGEKECVPNCYALSCLTGTCDYECDSDHVWNPVTLTCDPIPVVTVSSSQGVPYCFAAVMFEWLKHRRKRRFIII